MQMIPRRKKKEKKSENENEKGGETWLVEDQASQENKARPTFSLQRQF